MKKKKFALHLGLTLIAATALYKMATCRGDDDRIVRPEQETSFPAQTTGTIKGHVSFRGTPPEPKPVVLSGECAGLHKEPVMDDSFRVKDGRVQNALVYVKTGLEKLVFATPQEQVSVDQKECMFLPRVTAAMTRQPVQFLNSDPLQHNVTNPAFTFDTSPHLPRTMRRTQPGMYTLGCSLHSWMRGYVWLFDHPYFVLTDERGQFELRYARKNKGLPPGEYVIEVWHERLVTQQQKVTIAPGSSQEIEFVLEIKK